MFLPIQTSIKGNRQFLVNIRLWRTCADKKQITKTAVEDLKEDLVEAWKDDFDAVVALYQSETSVGDHHVNGESPEDEERIL